jgi:hypothetical protein
VSATSHEKYFYVVLSLAFPRSAKVSVAAIDGIACQCHNFLVSEDKTCKLMWDLQLQQAVPTSHLVFRLVSR